MNPAVISKLCILGEDVEPCFESANITDTNESTQFSANKDFHKTLYSMMQELNEILIKIFGTSNINIQLDRIDFCCDISLTEDEAKTYISILRFNRIRYR